MALTKAFALNIACFLACYILPAQNYQAIHGSSYAGSLAPANNPAAIVHVPYAWDITPFSIQVKQTTNAAIIEKYSLLSSPSSAEFKVAPGDVRRYAYANQDIHLLNTRIRLSPRSAIAFGFNIRSYLFATTSKTNWTDTSDALRNFMTINPQNAPLSGKAGGNAWASVYGTYALTILDEDERQLNAGITLKLNRAIAGGYAVTDNLQYVPATGAGGYLVTNGQLQYGYSKNFDAIDSNKTGSVNRKNFLAQPSYSVGADIGIEYIQLAAEDKSGNTFAYERKLGVSVLDLGSSRYAYGSRSRSARGVLPDITDTMLENKFISTGSFDQFNDSLATVANSISGIAGDFTMYHPTRLVINLDQHITQNFFLNAELTIPLMPVVAKNTLFIRDMNLLAFTPRWETQALGAYLPVLVNNRRQVWVGAAAKLGPVLLGTHNLANIFAKNKMQSGGVYLAFTVRPGKLSNREGNGAAERLPGKERRRLDCPKF